MSKATILKILNATCLFSHLILKVNGDDLCPCFSDGILGFFEADNISEDSCAEDPSLGSLHIWEIQDPDTWHPYGFGIDINHLYCLQEGDMIRSVNERQAKHCMDILLTRCNVLHLLLEFEPIPQIQEPSLKPISCPCFDETELTIITKDKISDNSCVKNTDEIGNLYVFERDNGSYWNGDGFGVEIPHLSCFAGDMVRYITQQESEVCMSLLRHRCEEIQNQAETTPTFSVIIRHISNRLFQHLD